MRKPILKTIFDDIGILTAAFTAAITDIITSAAHGLKDRDMIVLTTTNTLPAGLETDTVYIVDQATTNTFKLINKSTGATVDVTDTGTGTHTWTMHDVGYAINVEKYKNYEVMVNTDGGNDAEMDIYFLASYEDDAPDFSAAQAVDNSYFKVNVKNLDSTTAYAGSTGIAALINGSDYHSAFNIEANNIKWLCAIIDGYVAGEVTIKVQSGKDC